MRAEERAVVVTPASASAAEPKNLSPTSTNSPAALTAADAGISKDKAIQLAETHLALRNTRWGKPTDVEVQEDRYIVSYETPEVERRLLGQRRVSVQKSSGLVRVRERR